VPVNKTPAEPPDALLLRVHKKIDLDLTDSLLYLYDPGGEVMETEDSLRRHSYFKDVNGAILLIDPFSLAGIRERYRDAIDEVEGELSPSEAEPEHLVERLVTAMHALKDEDRTQRLKIPLSVVLTKWDAFDLDRVASLDLPIDEVSNRLRRWLEVTARAGNLVRTVESYFVEVRYFACSALGTMPGSGRSFSPKGVVEPIHWATHRNRVF
jgi:hypothetical protein